MSDSRATPATDAATVTAALTAFSRSRIGSRDPLSNQTPCSIIAARLIVMTNGPGTPIQPSSGSANNANPKPLLVCNVAPIASAPVVAAICQPVRSPTCSRWYARLADGGDRSAGQPTGVAGLSPRRAPGLKTVECHACGEGCHDPVPLLGCGIEGLAVEAGAPLTSFAADFVVLPERPDLDQRRRTIADVVR